MNRILIVEVEQRSEAKVVELAERQHSSNLNSGTMINQNASMTVQGGKPISGHS